MSASARIEYIIMKSSKLRIALTVSGILLAALLIAAGVLEIVRRETASSLPDQLAAQRWGGESAQLSCFFAEGEGYDVSRILAVEKSVDDALIEASLAAEDGARLWYHVYSTETSLYGAAARGSTGLCVTVFGGEYFYLHQMQLISGSYLAPGGANAGYIFLDENAAWQLFGALNISGMSMTLGGEDYIVCGVGRIPTGTLYDDAYGDTPRAWVLYESKAGKNVREITAYEAVLPDPIDGFAKGILGKIFPADENTVTVENSARFDLLPLFSHLKDRRTLGVRTSAVTYPWWENIARVTEFRCATLLCIETVLLACALLLCLIWIGIAWNPAERALKNGAVRLRDAAEEKYNDLTRPKPKKD